MKEEIKKAFDRAQNEVEEKKIAYLKNIIKDLLQKKVDKEKSKDELEEEIKLIKQDIDDFKAGRLDKIKERHEVNEKADKICPINITIINDNARRIYPLQPWRWNYELIGVYPLFIGPGTGAGSGLGLPTSANLTVFSGTSAQTFVGGSYSINNGASNYTINL